MIKKQATTKKVKKLVEKIVTPEILGCDKCDKQFPFYNDNKFQSYLEITIFNRDNNDILATTIKKQFCTWKCLFEYLPSIDCNYFISLPMTGYQNEEGQSIQDLLNCLDI